MFGKFFKYELKESSKGPLFIYILSLVATLNLKIYVEMGETSELSSNVGNGIYSFITIMLLCASYMLLLFGVLVTSVKRYNRTMFSNEGYLTHTLPISSRTIFFVKYIISIMWSIISLVLINVLLYIYDSDTFKINNFKRNGTSEALVYYNIYFAVIMICVITLFYMAIYLSIAIGNMAVKHKKAGSIGAFFLIYIIVEVVFSVVLNSRKYEIDLRDALSSLKNAILMRTTEFFLITFIFVVIMYIINSAILRKKLNI